MDPRRRVGQLVEVLVILFVVSLVAGQLLGQPVLLSYVTSGSMAPTLETGDGFVAVPADIAGPVGEGDVIVFRAQELQGGGLVTHRVVDETDRGFTTRGDANPFTDQDGEEPPVKRAQIVAVALRVDGEVVVIPNVGTVVGTTGEAITEAQRLLAATLGSRSLLGTQGLAYLVLALSAVAYVLDLLYGSDGGARDRTRETSRDSGRSARAYLLAFTLLLVLAATASMVIPSGSTQFSIISAEFSSPRPDIIPAGTSDTQPITIPNAGLIRTVVFLEPGSEGISVADPQLVAPARGQANTTMTLSAPPETGYYRRYLDIHRYLGILPVAVMRELYGFHPWAPIVAIDAVLGGSFYAMGRLLVGRGRVRRRDADRQVPLGVGIRRAVRRLFG